MTFLTIRALREKPALTSDIYHFLQSTSDTESLLQTKVPKTTRAADDDYYDKFKDLEKKHATLKEKLKTAERE